MWASNIWFKPWTYLTTWLSCEDSGQPPDDQTFYEVMNGDPSELMFWYDVIDAELIALYKKACFEVVSKSKAEGH